jgi:hypothetical protein
MPKDQNTDPASDEGTAPAPAVILAARVASLELDAETLEMVMAALTADVCDQVDTGTN